MNRTATYLTCLCTGLILTSYPVMADPLASDKPDTPQAEGLTPPGNTATTPPTPTTRTSSSPVTTPTTSSASSFPTTTTTKSTGKDMKTLETKEETGIWTRDYLTGNWGGLRTKLEDDGFTFTPTWIGEVFGNPKGGAAQGTITDGVFNLPVDFDLEKMSSGAVTDLTIHANAFYIYGPGLSAKYVGDFSNTSNIAGYNSLRLQELWVQKLFLDKKLSVKVGNMAIDTEYFLSTSSSLFINGTFGTFTLIANNIPNAPVYPVASPGVRVQVLPSDKFYVMAGVYGMDLASTPATDNHHGTHFAMSANSGVLVMSETGYLFNQGEKDTGLKGTYRLGSLVSTANYYNWGSQAQVALGTGSFQGAGTNFSIYGVADQQFFAKDDEAISVFMRGGGAPSNVNFVDAYIEGGFNFNGFFGRKDDIFGVALAHSHVSPNFSSSQTLQGLAPSTEESVLETTYKVQIAPWWSVQPDFQYIMNPSGVQGSPNAVVLGVRTSVAF